MRISRFDRANTEGVRGEFRMGWVGFLVVSFLYKSIPTHAIFFVCEGKRVAQTPRLTDFFLSGWAGLWGWGVRRFRNII